MSELEARGTRVLYDHEQEDGHALGRRRQPAADWGVGEELFDRMPSRRRFRAGDAGPRRDAHEAPRRDAHDAPRREVRGDAREARREVRGDAREAPRREVHEAPRREVHARVRPAAPQRPPVDHERPTDELTVPPRESARASDVDAWMAELSASAPATAAAPAAERRPRPEIEAAPPELEAAPPIEAAEPDAVEPPAEGRRTVVIRGRGAEGALPTRRDRRPPRTAGERIGPRPDRVAAWAVAMGVLLILIAILTAH